MFQKDKLLCSNSSLQILHLSFCLSCLRGGRAVLKLTDFNEDSMARKFQSWNWFRRRRYYFSSCCWKINYCPICPTRTQYCRFVLIFVQFLHLQGFINKCYSIFYTKRLYLITVVSFHDFIFKLSKHLSLRIRFGCSFK